jgi:hypothetical protein
MLPGSPLSTLPRSRTLVTAFPSPATAATSRQPPFQGQRSWPATSSPPCSLLRPVHLRLHCLRRFAPLKGRFLASSPLRFHLQVRLAASPASTPLREISSPSGSKRSTGSATTRLAFPIRPIAFRSPLPFLFLGQTADQRSRLATSSEACCSSNLLEPPSLCS